jgi:two-component system CheB/CheR fusion protein
MQSIDTATPLERRCRDRDGASYVLRIRPYKNVDNRIDGAVLTLFDIGADRRHGDEMRSARELAHALVETVREPVVVLDPSAHIHAANEAFCEVFELTHGDVEGSDLFEVSDGALDVDDFRTHIAEHFRGNHELREMELRIQLARRGATQVRVNARRFETGGGQPLMVLALNEAASAPGAGKAMVPDGRAK